ncbi:MAG: putative sugar transporter [Streblomastix strix]|uniref:Putative sugar transporter n=1 Tax=Streblomastix strix TaxID=222440 RepID=A0A5J4U9Q6_9EUKA|nr:MAG: putative sugar transporter [Streblomastix strix]
MTVFALILVDIIGRRPLLITGYSLMFLGNLLIILSDSITSLQKQKNAYLLSAPGIAVFLTGFEIGPGPLYYLIISEIYPTIIRGRAVSLMTSINWACNIVIVLLFLPLAKSLTIKWIYAIFSLLSLFTSLFVLFVLPETKKRSLEDISIKSASKLDTLLIKNGIQ